MRPEGPKTVRCPPLVREFGPTNDFGSPAIALNVDELEALRLADLLALNHTEGAARMEVSRATFGRVLERARAKVARALVQGRRLNITGEADEPPASGDTMRVAVAITEAGDISPHFRKSHAYRIVDIGAEGSRVIEDRPGPTLDAGGGGRGRRRHRGGRAEGGQPRAERGHGCGGRGWLDVFNDCQAAVTLGMGNGARDGLKRRGVRPIVLDHPTSVDDALNLVREGRL